MNSKGKQTALYPGNEDKVGYWLTPPDLMAKLQAEFDFDFDACPYPRPAGFDGLKEPWGKRNYVNPPFYRGASIIPWLKRGVLEAKDGKTVVFILPVSSIIEQLVPAGAEIRYLDRVLWENPDGEHDARRPRFPSALFILRPKP